MDRLGLISVTNKLISQKIIIFTVKDFVRFFNLNEKTARVFLSFHTKKNTFKRIKRGVYFMSSNPPSPFEIANYICHPSYISFETALSFHGIIPETVYTVTSATTKRNRDFNILGQSVSYNKIKKTLFFGYVPVKMRDSRIVLIADKEKAFLDYVYLKSLKKQPINERMDLSRIDKKKLGSYIGFFKRNIRKNKSFINLIAKFKI